MTARLLFSLLFVPVLCSAEIYRWVDAEGVTHFSDEPVVEEATVVDLPPITVMEGSDVVSRKDLLEAAKQREQERRRAAEQRTAQARKAADEEASRHEHCAQVRERIEEIQAEMRRGYTLKRGEVLKGWLTEQRENERSACSGY